MNFAWAAAGALAGLIIGHLLRGPVFRLSVASGEPEPSACPRCGAPLRTWLTSRCAQCHRILGRPLTMELSAALVLALLLGRFPAQPDVAALGLLGALGVAVAAIDIAVQRIPNRLILPAYPVLVLLLAVAALAQHREAALGRALLGGLALGAAFLILALIRPGQLGGGDVKLAGLAGLAMGWLGWQTLIFGAALGFLLCALVSLALIAARRISLNGAICFGPFLVGGAVLAIVTHG